MENLIALQTLNPQARSHSHPLPPPRRRSHLDSASYRTLVRIFSLCFDESVHPAQEPRDDATPISDAAAPDASECFSAGTGSIFGRNFDGCLDVELGRGAIESVECGGPRLDAALESTPSLEEIFRDEKGVNGETVNDLMPKVSQLQFRDDRDETLHKTIELGNPHEGSSQGVDDGPEEGLISDSKLSHEENTFIGQASESPVYVIYDCSKLIEVHDGILDSAGVLQGEVANVITEKDGTLCLDSNDLVVNLVDSNDQDVDLVGKSVQGSKHDLDDACIDGISSEAWSVESNALRTCSSSDWLHDITNEGHNECIKSSATDLSPNRFLILKPDEELFNSTNKLVENNQQKPLDSSTNNVIAKQPLNNILNALLNSDSDEEVEEGQIPGDFWNSRDSELMVHQNAFIESQKSDKGSHYSDLLDIEGSDCSDKNIIPRAINLEDDCSVVVDKKDGKAQLDSETRNVCSNSPVVGIKQQEFSGNALISHENNSLCQNKTAIDKDIEVQKKRKRGALTEERKAKKKKAKRMKRAAKEREQGVRRLKLLPVVKPKVVKICNYYLMGRCQKGDMCRYSHDATPLTKSQPCKHFACDSCLKGDDCPFDHQLSKYPCHNFQSNGTCHRGDKCKFSHKILTIEGSSVPVASNLVSPTTAENLKVGKQKNMNKKPANFSSPLEKTTSTKDFSSVKAPMQIPSGIRFISFGNGPSEGMKKPSDSLLIEKNGCNEQNPEKSSADKNKKDDYLSEKSLHKPQSEFGFSLSSMRTFAGDYLRNRSSSSASVATPVSRSLHSEASDASKILEEFLFTAGG